MYDVKLPIKTTELAQGIYVTKIMIQIMELVKIYYLIFRKWKSIYEEEKRQVQQTQIKLSINDTFYIMNLTYKV